MELILLTICVILRFVVLTQYRRVTDGRSDGQTDRETHNDSTYYASIASRG